MSSRVARAHDQKEREGNKVKLIYWHNAIPSLSLSFFIPLSCTARIVAQQYHKKCWKMLKRKVEKKQRESEERRQKKSEREDGERAIGYMRLIYNFSSFVFFFIDLSYIIYV